MLWLRFLKLVGVLALAAGTVGAVFPGDVPLKVRRRFAFLLVGPGLLLSWGLGFALAVRLRLPLLSTWVVGSLGLSLLSLQAVLYCAGREGRAGWAPGLLAVLTLLGTVALMVWRPS